MEEAKLYKSQINIVQKQSLQTLPDFKGYYRTVRRHGRIGGEITDHLIRIRNLEMNAHE